MDTYIELTTESKRLLRNIKYGLGAGVCCMAVAISEHSSAFGTAASVLFISSVINAFELGDTNSNILKEEQSLVQDLRTDLELGKQYDIC